MMKQFWEIRFCDIPGIEEGDRVRLKSTGMVSVRKKGSEAWIDMGQIATLRGNDYLRRPHQPGSIRVPNLIVEDRGPTDWLDSFVTDAHRGVEERG